MGGQRSPIDSKVPKNPTVRIIYSGATGREDAEVEEVRKALARKVGLNDVEAVDLEEDGNRQFRPAWTKYDGPVLEIDGVIIGHANMALGEAFGDRFNVYRNEVSQETNPDRSFRQLQRIFRPMEYERTEPEELDALRKKLRQTGTDDRSDAVPQKGLSDQAISEQLAELELPPVQEPGADSVSTGRSLAALREEVRQIPVSDHSDAAPEKGASATHITEELPSPPSDEPGAASTSSRTPTATRLMEVGSRGHQSMVADVQLAVKPGAGPVAAGAGNEDQTAEHREPPASRKTGEPDRLPDDRSVQASVPEAKNGDEASPLSRSAEATSGGPVAAAAGAQARAAAPSQTGSLSGCPTGSEKTGAGACSLGTQGCAWDDNGLQSAGGQPPAPQGETPKPGFLQRCMEAICRFCAKVRALLTGESAAYPEQPSGATDAPESRAPESATCATQSRKMVRDLNPEPQVRLPGRRHQGLAR